MLGVISCKTGIKSLFILSSRFCSKIIHHKPNNTANYTNSIEDQYFPSLEDLLPQVQENNYDLEIQEFNSELKALFGDLNIADPLTFNPLQNDISSGLNIQNIKSK